MPPPPPSLVTFVMMGLEEWILPLRPSLPITRGRDSLFEVVMEGGRQGQGREGNIKILAS